MRRSGPGRASDLCGLLEGARRWGTPAPRARLLAAGRRTTEVNASGSRQPPPEAARSRQPDVMRGRRAFPARDGSSDCSGIRDCERAGHPGQEGETRGWSARLSSWPGVQPGAELGALQARPVATALPRLGGRCCGGRARRSRGQASPGGSPPPGAPEGDGARRRVTSRSHAELNHY